MVLFGWDILFIVISVVMLAVYFNECSLCDQPIWSWLLVNACVATVACCVILFLKGKKLVFVSVLYVLIKLAWSIYGIVLVAKEKSCVDQNANGAHIFSILSISSNLIQNVTIVLVGSFIIGLKVAKMIEEEQKKSSQRKSFYYDHIYSVVNQIDTKETEKEKDATQQDVPLIPPPVRQNEYSYPVDEIILEDEIVADVMDVEQIELDPIDEIKLKFNL